MGIIKTKAIVIAEHNMNDFDKMVTLLTPDLGKIGCAAKGARRTKSTLMAGTQFLCFGEFVLYKGAGSYRINTCEPIEIFYNVRTDLDKLQYVTYITKIIQDVTYENQNTYNILQLFLNTVYMISETDNDMDFIVSIFKIKLLSLLGFTPRISSCIDCNEKEDLNYFSIKDDGLKCRHCGRQDTGAIEISLATLQSIIYILKAPAKKLYSFKVSDESKKELEIISKLYLSEKLEKEYKMEKII